MSEKIALEINIGKYKIVELPKEKALELLNKLVELRGEETQDVKEAKRIIEHFDVFYNVQIKKNKDAFSPPKSERDMVLGKVLVDKVKLIKEDNVEKVRIIFDRRVSEDLIVKALESIGYTVEIHRETI